MRHASIVVLVTVFSFIGLGCSSPKKDGNKPTKAAPQNIAKDAPRKGKATVEDLVKALPNAIADTQKFSSLLPTETLLRKTMRCEGKHPLIEMLKKAHGQMAKNIESSKRRIGLGRVVYDGITIRKTQKIAAGEVDKGCTAVVDMEIKMLTAKLKFIAKTGKAKVSGGMVNAIRLGDNGWFVLKM